MTTQFHNLTIVHPHSGKVSRSTIATLLIHEAGEYPLGFPDNRTRNDRAKDAAKQIFNNYPMANVHLEDVNGNIQIQHIY